MRKQNKSLRKYIEKHNRYNVVFGNFYKFEEDPAYWNKLGVYTPKQFDHYMAVETYTELFRQRYGFNPTYHISARVKNSSLKEIRKDIDKMSKEIHNRNMIEWNKASETNDFPYDYGTTF